MFENTPNHIRLLNSHLQENEIWRKLAKAVTDVINEIVDEPRWALSRARQSKVVNRGDYVDTPSGRGQVTLIRRNRSNIDIPSNTYDFEDIMEVQLPNGNVTSLPVRALHDRDSLVEQARFEGFDYFSDVLQDDDYERIVDYIGGYWNESGGYRFMDMISFIKRQRYDIEQLFTEMKDDPGDPEWVNFAESSLPKTQVDEYDDLEVAGSGQQLIFQSPNFALGDTGPDKADPSYKYRTSHIQLSWDIIDFPSVDFIGVTSLFYLMAPIHLVLDRFVGGIFAEERLRAGLGTQIHTINQGTAAWEHTGLINLSVNTTSQIHSINQGAVLIPFPLP